MKTRHPLHSAVVHFPIALWTASLACDAAALGSGDGFWWQAGFWSLLVGFLLAIPAVVTGFLESITIKADDPAASTATFHMGIMTTAAMLFFMSLLARGGMEAPSGMALLIALGGSLLGFALLVVGGWLAADLVFRYGVGARCPVQEEERGAGMK